MDTLVVAGAVLGAWSDIGGLGTIWVPWLAGLVDYLSFFGESSMLKPRLRDKICECWIRASVAVVS
jgi:hypothetical protein